MKVYGHPISGNTRKVFAVARSLGVAIELVLVDLMKGEQRRPDFLRINPAGRTPVLVDGDFVLPESNAIMIYLASRQPTSLWPDEPRTRADIAHWLFWEQAHFGRACGILLYEHVIKPNIGQGNADPAQVKLGTAMFHREAMLLDAHLDGHRYLVGDGVTLADYAVASYVQYAGMAQLPFSDYPNVMTWNARMEADPAWAASAAMNAPPV
jgi:glutathione S-transferase